MHLHGDTQSLISGEVTANDSMGVYNSPARQHGAGPSLCARGRTEPLQNVQFAGNTNALEKGCENGGKEQ